MSFAPFESMKMSNGNSTSKFSCSKIEMVHFVCFAQAVAAIYLASVDESATVRCFRAAQATDAPVNKKQNPVVEQCVSLSPAKSESLYAMSSWQSFCL